MRRLITLGDEYYFNPAHVRSIEPVALGTKVTFSDGKCLQVRQSVADVVTCILLVSDPEQVVRV